MLVRVALKSLLNRRATFLLTVLAIAISFFVLLAVEHVRSEARDSFSRTVSGVDLIVGARTSPLNLLLYSVFHIGNATNNISWQSYQSLASNRAVAWTVPISLGDSHRGYRVMGTSQDYFEYFRYGSQKELVFQSGEKFEQVFDVVLGAEVARELNYKVGQQLVLSHGLGKTSFSKHDDKPFRIVGVLKPTGTPVDKTLLVSLAGIEAIHIDWQNGVPLPGKKVSAEKVLQHDLTPKSITAFMVGLNSKMATFRLQREITNYRQEPMVAILPGVALAELWQMTGSMEKVLVLISLLVLLASLIGMAAMLLASMRERYHEIAVLRAVGASPWFILLLIELEALLICLAGMGLGMLALWLSMSPAQSYLSEQYGIFVSTDFYSNDAGLLVLLIIVATAVMALIPAVNAYRRSAQMGVNNS